MIGIDGSNFAMLAACLSVSFEAAWLTVMLLGSGWQHFRLQEPAAQTPSPEAWSAGLNFKRQPAPRHFANVSAHTR